MSLMVYHQRDWDEFLPITLMDYRSSRQESTGQTSYLMLFGREIDMPVDMTCMDSQRRRSMRRIPRRTWSS